ncbi:MAG: hypothetical protein RQ745_02055 [Longimicrobiales bacterium]|nr:hypothetical protein [Longimicrobiales bacterium]
MRFAYIDSQGKEVPIPGADALRLRIELGAVTDTTRFYDASQDRWAPAAEHEIYRTLKREVGEPRLEGFVIPPPMPPEPPSTITEDPVADEVVAEDPAADEVVAEDPAADEVVAEDPAADEVVIDLPAIEDAEAEEVSTDEGDDFEFNVGGGELTLAASLEDLPELPPISGSEPLESEPVESEPLESEPLESEPVKSEPVEEAEETGEGQPRWNVAAELDGAVPLPGEADLLEGPEAVDEAAEPERTDGAPDFEGPDFGMAFEGVEPGMASGDEGPTDEGPTEEGGPSSAVEDDLVIESSAMTGFDPDAPPSWMTGTAGATEGDEAHPEGSGASFRSEEGEPPEGSATAGASEDRDDPYDRQIRARSAPPRRKITPRGSGRAGRLIGAFVLLAALGAGGWFVVGAWEGGGSQRGRIVLPELPAELHPHFRQLAERASRRLVESMDSLPERLALPAGPGAAWLSGDYLANASNFGGVADYWNAMAAHLAAIGREADRVWPAAFEEEVAADSLAPEDATLLLERARAGWSAAATDRQIVYDEFRQVIDASLALHDFLVANEAAIRHEPAAGGGSRDPVLEAVPATPALGEEMWERVGAITAALDAFGYLQQVETEPMVAVLEKKLVTTGIR